MRHSKKKIKYDENGNRIRDNRNKDGSRKKSKKKKRLDKFWESLDWSIKLIIVKRYILLYLLTGVLSIIILQFITSPLMLFFHPITYAFSNNFIQPLFTLIEPFSVLLSLWIVCSVKWICLHQHPQILLFSLFPFY